jgi:hypothetical protein
VLLDGTTSAKRRGDFAAAFKQNHYSVMVAGLNAMGEGHSFECCSNLILPSLFPLQKPYRAIDQQKIYGQPVTDVFVSNQLLPS